MYPRWMLNLLFYFDLWGFCTQIKRSPNQLKFDRSMLTLHIIFASISTLLISKYLSRPGDDKLGMVNDIMKFTVLLLVYWLSIFELYSKRRIQRQFWCIVHYIDKRFCSLQRFNLGYYPMKIEIYFTLTIFIHSIFFKQLLSSTRIKFLYFWITYILIVWIYQNRAFYYLFYLEWIKNELKIVNHEAHEIVATYQKKILIKRLRIFQRNRFKWLRQYYGSTYDLSDALNIIFGWSNVVTILVSVHLILADLNWFYWKNYNKHNPSIIRKEI